MTSQREAVHLPAGLTQDADSQLENLLQLCQRDCPTVPSLRHPARHHETASRGSVDVLATVEQGTPFDERVALFDDVMALDVGLSFAFLSG